MLWLAATVPIAVRVLAASLSRHDDVDIRSAEGEVVGLFLTATGLALLTSMLALALFFDTNRLAAVLAVVISMMTGFLTIADTYRVSLRTDHISSLWQMFGSIAMLAGLLAFSRYGLLPAVLIYFGVPAATQGLIFVQLWRVRRFSLVPRIRPHDVTNNLVNMAPILLNNFADYARVYGSGLILSLIAPVPDYARFTTVVVLVARFVNPVSLITRPLMPAYIDAVQAGDVRWLRYAKQTLNVVAACGIFSTGLLIIFLHPTMLKVFLPISLGRASQLEVSMACVLLLSSLLMALLAPLYLASNRASTFASVNTLFVMLGILGGALCTSTLSVSGMMTGVALGTSASAVYLFVYAQARLFSLE